MKCLILIILAVIPYSTTFDVWDARPGGRGYRWRKSLELGDCRKCKEVEPVIFKYVTWKFKWKYHRYYQLTIDTSRRFTCIIAVKSEDAKFYGEVCVLLGGASSFYAVLVFTNTENYINFLVMAYVTNCAKEVAARTTTTTTVASTSTSESSMQVTETTPIPNE